MPIVKKLEAMGKLKRIEGEVHKHLKGLSAKAKANIVRRIAKDPELKRTWLYLFEINRLEQQIEQNPLLISEMFLDRNKLRIHRLFNTKVQMIAELGEDDLNNMEITTDNLENPWEAIE